MKKFILQFFVVFSMFWLAGCGSSSHSTSSETGVVYGLNQGDLYYVTPTQRGLLGANGEFKYKNSDELVNVYLGKDSHGVKIGSFQGKAIVTTDDFSNIALFNDAVLKLLLSVDFNKTALLSDSPYKDMSFKDIFLKEGFDANSSFGQYLLNNKIATKIATDEEVQEYKNKLADELNPKIGILINLAKYPNLKDSILPFINAQINSYLLQHQALFKNISFVIKDTKGDKNTALEELKQLNDEGVKVVIGPLTSDIASYIVDYANNNNMVLLSPSSTAISLEKKDNLFRLAPNDSIESKALTDLIKHNTNTKYVLPLVVNDVYGNDYLKALQDNFQNSNVTVLPVVYIDNNNLAQTKDNALQELSDYNSSEVSVVAIDLYPEEIKSLIKECNNTALTDLQWYSDSVVINSDISDISDIANKIKLSGVSFDNEGTFFQVYYNTLKNVLDNSYTNLNPYLYNMIDGIWLATDIYSKNEEVYQDFIMKKNDAIDYPTYVQKESYYLEGSRGTLIFDENGDSKIAAFGYYTYDNNWTKIGMYKVDPFDNESVTFTQPSTTVKNIKLDVIIASDDQAYIDNAQVLIGLAQNNLNNLYPDANFSINITTFSNDTLKENILYYAMNEINENNVSTFVTDVASRNLALLSDYGQETNTYFIDAGSTAISLEKQDTTYRLIAPDDKEVKALVWKLDKDNIKNVVIIHSDDIYGNEYAQAIKDDFNGTIVKDISFENNTYVSDNELDDLKGKDFAVIYVGLANEGINPKYIPDVLKDKKWYASSSITYNPDFLNADIDLTYIDYNLDGIGIVNPGKYLLENITHNIISSEAIRLYDAVYVAALANYRDEANLHDSIPQTLRNTNGMSGFLDVDENGDRTLDSYVFYRNLAPNRWFKVDTYSADTIYSNYQ